MRFNSQELGERLAGLDACGVSDCTGGGCSFPSVTEEDGKKREDSKKNGEDKKDPGKKKESYFAGLELLRAQLRESLGSAAR